MEDASLQDISNKLRGLTVGTTFSRREKAKSRDRASDAEAGTEPEDLPLPETPERLRPIHAGKKAPRGEGYRRKVPLPKNEQEDASMRHYLAELKAHFSEVDAFELVVESPLAGQPTPEQLACPRKAASEQITVATPQVHSNLPDALLKGHSPVEELAKGEQAAQPSVQGRDSFHDLTGTPKPSSKAPRFGLSRRSSAVFVASTKKEIVSKVPTLGLSRRSSAIFAASPQKSVRQSSLGGHRPRMSHVGAEFVNAEAREGAHGKRNRSSLLSRLSGGLNSAVQNTWAVLRQSDANSRPEATENRVMPEQNVPTGKTSSGVLPAAPHVPSPDALPARSVQPPAEFSPIAESPEFRTEEISPIREEDSHLSAQEALTQQFDQKLSLEEQDQASVKTHDDVSEEGKEAGQLSSLQQLLRICGQSIVKEDIPSMEQLVGQHARLDQIRKIGEGTFGEAFKAGRRVFKIVPLDGDLIVNGEVQKTSEEIFAEAAISSALSQLRLSEGGKAENATSGFVELHGMGVCIGRYCTALVTEWHAWDERVGSENDPVDAFPEDQLYVVYVVADGGSDLEKFDPRSFAEARSILLQCALSLAVAEEACEYEHRDLHWGNLLISRQPQAHIQCKLRGVPLEARTEGLLVTLIDFTLSRLRTSDGDVAFSDLNADPALFKGPKGDCQSETYRRMKKANKGDWRSFTPATNTLWMHYLADILLDRKLSNLSPGQKRELRNFRKRCLNCSSCVELVTDEFFGGLWQTMS